MARGDLSLGPGPVIGEEAGEGLLEGDLGGPANRLVLFVSSGVEGRETWRDFLRILFGGFKNNLYFCQRKGISISVVILSTEMKT